MMTTTEGTKPSIGWRAIWTFYEVADPPGFARRMTRGFGEHLDVQSLQLSSGPDGTVTITSTLLAGSTAEAAAAALQAVESLSHCGDPAPRATAALVVLPH